jgi:hypothetical protein
VQVVEPQFEVLSIPELVSLSFESFDFVDQTLDGVTGDAMIEVVEKSGAVRGKGLSHSFEDLDAAIHEI